MAPPRDGLAVAVLTAPHKRQRTNGSSAHSSSTKSNGQGADCVHFAAAAAVYAHHLRAKMTAPTHPQQQLELEHLERYQLQPGSSVCDEIYECLLCSFSGVREHTSRSDGDDPIDSNDDCSFMAHAILHDHPLALLARKQQLYCARCRDFVYPDALLATRAAPASAVAAAPLTISACSRLASWSKRHAPPATPRRPSRRGLVNMGSTCYMNVVLQMFAHNPLLQYYFLVAKSHGTTICEQTRRHQQQQQQATTTSDTSPPATLAVCLGCDVDEFMATLSPPMTALAALTPPTAAPFVPHKLLEAFWRFAPAFIGAQQHDAHEFFLALLGGLHAHTHPRMLVPGGTSPRFTPTGSPLCDCVVHQHFAGALVSQVECAVCDQVSSTFDPFLDLSLSLDKLAGSAASADADAELSLHSLLRQFTAEESLRGINRVYCRRCRAYANMTKRLRVHRLPNVLVVHIKRLDFHKQQKLSCAVRFPLTRLRLDEFVADGSDDYDDGDANGSSAPKASSAVTGGERAAALLASATTAAAAVNGHLNRTEMDADSELYDLAAVVNHHGDSVQGGHYTAFIQSSLELSQESHGSDPQWFLFDDTRVTPATEEQVAQSQAYMLVYVKQRPTLLLT